MKFETGTMALIYLSEGDMGIDQVLTRLRRAGAIKGVTDYRGIAGYGLSGRVHEAHLLDLSLDLPLVVEFFDTAEQVRAILHALQGQMELPQVVTWPVQRSISPNAE